MKTVKRKVAIIGAGLAGMTAAHYLKDHLHVCVFEKARGVGGRMSTRRAPPYQFNHGAQYFTARSDTFKRFLAPLLDQGLLSPWEGRFVSIEGDATQYTVSELPPKTRYIGVPGMNALVKHMSQTIPLQLSVRVQTLQKSSNQWLLLDENNHSLGLFDWVIIAVPPEQAALLVPASISQELALPNLKMHACFSLMLGFERDIDVDFDAARVQHPVIQWIARHQNSSTFNKGSSLVVQTTAAWSDKHIDDNRENLQAQLLEHTRQVLRQDVSSAQYQSLHAWRYARCDQQANLTHYLNSLEHIGLCGDWFIEGRVEAAFTSGRMLAQQLVNHST